MRNGLSAWGRTGSGFHGSLRGADSPRRSPTFEGRFGRMFRTLPAATYSTEDLVALGKAMEADAEVIVENGVKKRDKSDRLVPTATAEAGPDNPGVGPDDEENYGIPAGYTYLGQFIDHDITFDPMSSLMGQNDPESLVDFRSPRLDLDNLYGRGPADQPYMYEADAKTFLLSKTALLRNNAVPPTRVKPHDLQRLNGRAVIGDKRNDENVIVSQLQGMFLNFHNAMVKEFPKDAEFETIQREVRWHYQWTVLNDFLPKIVGEDMVHAILPHLADANGSIHKTPPCLKWYKWRDEPFIPVEFAAAAYRFGHSMVRPIYRLSQELTGPVHEGEFKTNVANRKFIFAALRDRGLNGFEPFPQSWAIDWSLFFELDGKKLHFSKLGPDRVQPSYKIDTSLVNPLAFLPEFSEKVKHPSNNLVANHDGFPRPEAGKISSLAVRNLLRGQSMGLPSGQAIARLMGVEEIPDDRLRIGKAIMDDKDKNPSINSIGASFTKNAPLWFYILAEAQDQWVKAVNASKETDPMKKNALPVCLGPVGGRIVAEVLIGLLVGDHNSFIYQDSSWRPKHTNNGKFGMPEMIKFSGLG